MAKKTATMQEVANAIGVSVSTVSRVFSDSDFARGETRDRVMKTANRLGYSRLRRRETSQPIRFLSSHFTRESDVRNIVLLASEADLKSLGEQEWIYRDLVPTLHRLAKEKGFHLIFSSYGQEDQWDPAAMAERQISGVLWMSHERKDLLATIRKTVPVVVLNNDYHWPPQTSLPSDNRMVMFRAAEHLVELGHRRIGFFGDEAIPEPEYSRNRQAAYREAIAHFHLEPDLCFLERFGENEHPQAITRAMDRMAAMKKRPTALITGLIYAIQFLKEARRRSINVPDDLSIVAFDNAPVAEMVDPSLTAIDRQLGRRAEVAVDLLLEKTGFPWKQVRTIVVEPKLIVRNSTSAPRSKA